MNYEESFNKAVIKNLESFKDFGNYRNLKILEPEVFCEKNGGLKYFANFTRKHLLESLFNKVVGLQASNFIIKTPTQAFSC